MPMGEYLLGTPAQGMSMPVDMLMLCKDAPGKLPVQGHEGAEEG